MKKIPQKNLNSLMKLQKMQNTLAETYEKNFAELQQKYNILDDHFDYKFEEWTENDYNFADASAELHAKYTHTERLICAKWAAKFLIATNIARRGKLLHPDVAIRKLGEYGNEGKRIIDMIKTPVLPMVLNSEPYLARELYKSYDVMLLDKNMYAKLYDYINYYPNRKSDKYKNLLKKFHKNVINGNGR